MNFSVEELYFMYGQYDAFVSIEFHYGTKAYELFGRSGIMGTFKYTLEERTEFEKLRGTENIPRTAKNFRLIPSELHKLDEPTRLLLDRDGLLCSDIAVVSSFNRKRENRFIVKGEKEIPDKITITIPESSQQEIDLMNIGMLKSRLRDGYTLAYFEVFELYGLLLFYRPAEVIENPELYTNFEKKELKNEIKFHFLYCKYLNGKASPEEIEEMKRVKLAQLDIRKPIVINEIKKNGLQISKLHDLDKTDFRKAIAFLTNIDNELILPYRIPIWCDFERLAHIYLGHIEELYIGAKNGGNTFFQYSFKESRRVINNVLQILYDDFVAETSANGKTFVRRGSRAAEFDGHYYRVEIRPDGQLLTFHPYNNNNDRQNDN